MGKAEQGIVQAATNGSPEESGHPIAPNAEAKSFEIDVFAFIRFARSAAFYRDSQETPECERFAGVIIAIVVGIPFEQPAPRTPFAARIGIFLPALEDAGH